MKTFFVRIPLLSLWYFFCVIFSSMVVGAFVPLTDQPSPRSGLYWLILIALIETSLIYWLVTRLRLWGWRLLLVLLLIVHFAKTALMMIELAFFLNLWTIHPLIGLDRVFALEIQGLMMACLYCPLVILIANKWRRSRDNQDMEISRNALPLRRLAYVALLYAFCYWIAGAFLLIPLAGANFAVTYGQLQVPVWMPLFQVGRGLMWAILLWLLVRYLPLRALGLYVAAGLVLTILGSAQLLSPNPFMPDGLRYAHMLEMTVSMMVFGMLGAWILRDPPPSSRT